MIWGTSLCVPADLSANCFIRTLKFKFHFKKFSLVLEENGSLHIKYIHVYADKNLNNFLQTIYQILTTKRVSKECLEKLHKNLVQVHPKGVVELLSFPG